MALTIQTVIAYRVIDTAAPTIPPMIQKGLAP